MTVLSCAGASEHTRERRAYATIDTASYAKGRVTSTGAGGYRRTFGYDPRGRTVNVQYGVEASTYTFSTTYGDANGAPKAVAGEYVVAQTYSDGETLAFTYDAGGAQRSLTAGGAPIVTRIVRNVRGQTTEVDFGDGTVTTRRYNNGGDQRLAGIHTVNGATDLQQYGYSSDAAGNIIGVADYRDGSLSASYGYDALDRLTSMSSGAGSYTYAYDDAGNLTSKEGQAQTYGQGAGPHALTSAGIATFAYDSNGNAITADGVVITWNAENMPIKQVKGGTTVTKSFFGEELWKRVEPTKTTYFLPSERLEGTKIRKYYGSFAERDPDDGNQLKFYHGDHLGSSTLVTNDGNVVHRAAYYPYGEKPDGTERLDTASFPFKFKPKYQFNFKEKEDPADGGFYDYGARLYNPRTGRFLSADSATADGYNRYAYVRDNPLRFRDPNGHESARPEDVRVLQEFLQQGHSFGRHPEGELTDLQLFANYIVHSTGPRKGWMRLNGDDVVLTPEGVKHFSEIFGITEQEARALRTPASGDDAKTGFASSFEDLLLSVRTIQTPRFDTPTSMVPEQVDNALFHMLRRFQSKAMNLEIQVRGFGAVLKGAGALSLMTLPLDLVANGVQANRMDSKLFRALPFVVRSRIMMGDFTIEDWKATHPNASADHPYGRLPMF
jgi:RHS repeat-associated protein